ncbi:MAG: polysaccharide deacetylase family protein [Bacilli bacterium]|nr:polysaccharide deacetylase family protein [Bacilli bacterium]
MYDKEQLEFIKELEIKNALYKSQKKKKRLLLWTIILILILIGSIAYFVFLPNLQLKGEKNITLEYSSSYKEPGYQAYLYGKNITNQVKTKGKINTKRIGSYKIEYTITNGILVNKMVRKIMVVDTKKPNIILKGKEDTYLCPNQKYKEEGFEAKDEYDGILTDKVQIIKKENEIIYTVSDSSKNKVEQKRKLITKDIEKPTITLAGTSPFYLYRGSTYQEPGYQAYDNCEGDITNKVTVSGSVDTSQIGSYAIKYIVKDAAGNQTETQRDIVVRSERNANNSADVKGSIYLTFDDGPGGATKEILDILKEEGVSATFFVTGNGADDLIKREFDEGHTVALHTYTHDYAKVYASIYDYFSDLNKIRDRVERITGHRSNIIRFPGGSSNTVSKHYNLGIMSKLTKDVLNRGYHYFDWNVDSGDAGECAASGSTKCVYENVIKGLSKNKANVVLLHDVKSYTAAALKDIIRYGKEHGYTFLPITEDTKMVTHSVHN